MDISDVSGAAARKRKPTRAILGELCRALTLKFFRLCAAGGALFSLLACFGSWAHLPDLATHFRPQYFALGLISLISFAWLRRKWWMALAALVLLFNLWFVAPWYFPVKRASANPPNLGANFRVVLSNVLFSNRDFDAVLRLAREENPDVLVLQEMNRAWLGGAQPLERDYPHRMLATYFGLGGVLVLSRYPLTRAPVMDRPDWDVSGLAARVDFHGRPVSLIALHPPSPESAQGMHMRNRMLDVVAGAARDLPSPLILIGDLNTTMWSPSYTRLESGSGLRNARRGFGLLPTWPTFLPVMYIPIDHCLVSPDIEVIQCRTGRRVGSDHLPLVVDLRIPGGVGGRR
ncbi:MAG: endonuclease/exonuclease/phosphatase family protein [Blastocatellia bacterium]